MKKNLNRTLILAAVALALGSAAYGQQNITATIPFNFKTAGGSHEAGTYNVIANPADAVFRLQNKTSGKAVSLGMGRPEGGATGQERPRLVFHCADDGGCVLAQVWTGDGRGWSYGAPQVRAPKYESAVVVYYHGEAK